MKLPPSILRYWLAMNATAFDSAVHAVILFCGMAGAHEATQAVPALNLPQLAALFLIAFGRALLAYLDAHPVSEFLINIGGGSPATPTATGAPMAIGAEPIAAPAHFPVSPSSDIRPPTSSAL